LYLGDTKPKQLCSLRIISVSVCCAFVPSFASAGDPQLMPAGAAEAGMAYVSVMKTGLWSAFHNQALLSLCRTFSCGVNYENRFGIKELATSSLAISAPFGRTSLGGVYSSFGCRDYRRQMAGIACALPVSGNISAGVQIDYFSERAWGEYVNISSLTFEAGVLIDVSRDFQLGIHLFNPVPNSIRKNEMVSVLTAGAGGKIGPGLFAGIETEMTTEGTFDLRTGFEYEAAVNFMIRAGFRTLNSSFSFGIGYNAGPAKIDIAFSTHEKLGLTSSISLIFKIKNQK
jgi:hypothetical protein